MKDEEGIHTHPDRSRYLTTISINEPLSSPRQLGKRKRPEGIETHARLGTFDLIINSILERGSILQTFDDGDNLVRLFSARPNTLITTKGGLTSVLVNMSTEAGDDLFWEKHQTNLAYKNISNDQASWSITQDFGADQSERQTKLPYCHVKRIVKDFTEVEWMFWREFIRLSESEDRSGYFQVTLTREDPREGNGRLRVVLLSSEWQRDGTARGGQNLGEWWLSEIRTVEDLDVVKMMKDLQYAFAIPPGRRSLHPA